ncbi:MAG: NADH-quinone oxidoreductase subunit J [bacterium]|nr:NADH-quinone oxidoreductase subunit J [bacterium]
MNVEQIFLLFVDAVLIGSAIYMIIARNMVMSVLSMIVSFVSLAILYLTLGAQFIAVTQIIVYAGGIMVLFLFVIMLLNIKEKEHPKGGKLRVWLSITIGIGILIEIIAVVASSVSSKISSLPPDAAKTGTVESVGTVLYTTYLLPFEAVSFLLLAATIGALVLAKKKFP